MTYEDSLRVLLHGTCGANVHSISRDVGIQRPAIVKFLAGTPVTRGIVDALGLFVFRRMNAHLLIGPSDLEGDRCQSLPN